MFGKLFKKSSFGLEIGDESIKFVELISSKDGIRVGRYGEQKIPAGVIESGKIINQKKLVEILTSLKKNFGLRSVHLTLSNEYGQNISEYLSALKNSKISVKSFEPKMQALSRSVIGKGDRRAYMIVDFGGKRSVIFITASGEVLSGADLEFGEKDDAHSVLRDEMAKHFLYWHTYKSKEDIDNSPIEKIILCGNGSGLADLAERLSVSMRNKVELADVWINIADIEKYIPEINSEQSFGFASVLGLALKDF